MDKKSFFRGFGVGVLFAAIILGISFMVRTSDPYVTSRAKELGMVYQSESESELKLAKKDSENDVTATPAATKVSESTKEELTTATPAPTQDVTAAPEATDSTNSAKKDTAQKEDTKKKMQEEKEKMEKEIRQEQKTLTINAGDWSSDVSKKLEYLGIISSAKDFDKYLNDNGYSSSISAGTYTVSIDDTYADLARKITGR